MSLIINLTAVVDKWQLGWDHHWCGFLSQIQFSALFQVFGCVALLYGFWPRLAGEYDGTALWLRHFRQGTTESVWRYLTQLTGGAPLRQVLEQECRP
ncbi:MAG: hypothetical protein GPOALKHO_000325 [Sodalis sp.]|uniref:hypothetical protein n=1 Tax=Sodalis sp. (in: enterobacteria) TaxID=1898979 RepID=UPI0038730D9C|nr:MAG: hypothetical protein GPOALKHO_000325 [Sodalis sp.]